MPMPTSRAGSLSKKKRRFQSAPGMTLIELMVGMFIVGIILAIAVVGSRGFTDAEMKKESNRLASTIRYLYNKSATERLYLRIVYDFGEHSYHVESTSEPFVITPPDPEAEEKAKQAEPEAAEDGGQGESGEGAGEAEEGAAQMPDASGFAETESYLLKPVQLAGDVLFKDIQVSYAKEKIEAGKAYTYFFPNGYATPTMINLQDEDDETNYSLQVLPLSGRVRIESRYRELGTTEEQ